MTTRKSENFHCINIQGSTVSRNFCFSGCVGCAVSMATAALSLTLPYWIYVSGTFETTSAGLTDATKVVYFFGLLRYCLKMEATHLNLDQCADKKVNALESWESVCLITLIASVLLMAVTLVLLTLHMRCWNKFAFLVTAAIAAIGGASCQAVGVSLYQIRASVQVIEIGGLTKANFEPGFLRSSFWLDFASTVFGMLSGLLIMLGAFTWQKPKERRRMAYKTIVGAPRCPHRGRKAAKITITHM